MSPALGLAWSGCGLDDASACATQQQLELEGRTGQAVGVMPYGVFFLALAMRGSLLDRLLERNLPLHLILPVQRM